jgi:hypothetical protein
VIEFVSMATADIIALVGLAVAILGCLGTWIVVPGFQRWFQLHRLVAISVSLFFCVLITIFVARLVGRSKSGEPGSPAASGLPPSGQALKRAPTQPPVVQQTTIGAGSPAVQGVQGNVTITVDQGSPKTTIKTSPAMASTSK